MEITAWILLAIAVVGGIGVLALRSRHEQGPAPLLIAGGLTGAALLLALLLGGGSNLYASQAPTGSGPSNPHPPLGHPATQMLWHDVPDGSFALHGPRDIRPTQYRTVALDPAALAEALAVAPLEHSAATVSRPQTLALPLPQGGYGWFRIEESSILAPALAGQFPDIHTYTAQGIDDPTAAGRLDRTSVGFHGLIQTAGGAIYIDPYSRGDLTHYVSYFGQAYPVPAGLRDLPAPDRYGPPLRATAPAPPVGTVLRTYRLAVAATSQYTAFQGGTTALALAAITTAVNRLDSVFEREVAVRMTLIANETAIIYTPGMTDPYTNDDPSAMLDQNQTNLDRVIGAANYDIGHVFAAASGGGIAYVGVVCNATYKARGATASTNPVGDPYAIELVAHEIGHQFGGQHTYNAAGPGSCTQGRSAQAAYEPGTGSTIMGYAGTCGESNLQDRTDPYFVNSSFDQIVGYTSGDGGSCGVQTPTGNDPPVVNAGADYTIPINTPFQLTGSATDPNGDALTYSWEEHDLGTASPPDNDDGSRPLFRSYLPSTSPTRSFPRLDNLLNNNRTALGEILPTTNRTLNFRLVARDNRAGGGGVAYGSVAITTTNTAGPFAVTAPLTDTWTVSSTQTVTWNVANTDQAPISCPQVNILLSSDGGQTFPTILAANAANSGSQTITVPAGATTGGRVKVACANNIFFDISHGPLTITGGTGPLPGVTTTTPTGTPATATATQVVLSPTATHTACVTSFSDVPPSAFFYPYVQFLYCNDFISGYSDGTFRPYNNTTRGQMVKIVTLAFDLGSAPPAAGQYTFADVLPTSTYFQYVEAAAGDGVVSGYTCGGPNEPCDSDNRPYFRPSALVTRAQLAKIIVAGTGWPTVGGILGQTFADVPATDPFNAYIGTLFCRTAISGYACGGPGEPCDSRQRPYFRPSSNAFREQIAKMIYIAAQNPEPCVGP